MELLFTVPNLPMFEAGDGGRSPEEYAVCFEEIIKRSRFITLIAHVDSRQKALAFVEEVRRVFPNATHYCWAYVAGGPGDTACIGQSDDGEPHGTAGRPMLTQLLHGGMGEIAAVTVRFFGGIKLGTGGLTRAYQNGVRNALSLLQPVTREQFSTATAVFDYGYLGNVQRLLQRMDGKVLQQEYGESVTMTINVPSGTAAAFRREFADATDGSGVLEL
jgi:uncharacterized YigZ family protein